MKKIVAAGSCGDAVMCSALVSGQHQGEVIQSRDFSSFCRKAYTGCRCATSGQMQPAALFQFIYMSTKLPSCNCLATASLTARAPASDCMHHAMSQIIPQTSMSDRQHHLMRWSNSQGCQCRENMHRHGCHCLFGSEQQVHFGFPTRCDILGLAGENKHA